MNDNFYIRGHPLHLRRLGLLKLFTSLILSFYQPYPLLFPRFGLCGSMEVFCFSFSPISILASAAARGLSSSHSSPSPSWPLWQPEGFMLRMYCRLEMYCKTWFGWSLNSCFAQAAIAQAAIAQARELSLPLFGICLGSNLHLFISF